MWNKYECGALYPIWEAAESTGVSAIVFVTVSVESTVTAELAMPEGCFAAFGFWLDFLPLVVCGLHVQNNRVDGTHI